MQIKATFPVKVKIPVKNVRKDTTKGRAEASRDKVSPQSIRCLVQQASQDPELLEEINSKVPVRDTALMDENKIRLKNWTRRETNRHLIISSAERLRRESAKIRKAHVD